MSVPTALIVVDMQPDFMPGGALAVTGGDDLVAPIAGQMKSGVYDCIVVTQDWHRPGHISFASSHPNARPFDQATIHGKPHVLWPDHCLAGSPGARIHDTLDLAAADLILRKGTDPDVDSYSAFRSNWNRNGERPATGLAGFLQERGIERVVLCGLARDVCVRWTAEDALVAGFDTFFMWDLTRSVDPAGDVQLRRKLLAIGADVIDGEDLPL